jgi:putative flavoprotein involved in K+ transport
MRHDTSKTISDAERVDTVVIGGGQAGLSMGYQLARRGLPFVILDASARVGDAWRKRWDSLRLFTPARYAGFAGGHFPAPAGQYVTKDQIADYLEHYAERFRLPVELGVRVDHVSPHGERYLVKSGARAWIADNVVVAMSNYQEPRVPSFARALAPHIVQLHSKQYRNPRQLRAGRTLVVGAGNSGGEIALELSRTHQVWLSGKESGHIPFRIDTFLGRHFLVRLVRFLGHHVLSLRTPIGRKVRPKLLHAAAPFVRVKPTDLIEAGVERVSRVVGVREGLPVLADGRALEVENVVWCTGFEHGFPWIDLPIFDEHGEPAHERGLVPSHPGFYFVGLHFLYAMSSATVIGVARDAKRIAKVIASRPRMAESRGVRATEMVAAKAS